MIFLINKNSNFENDRFNHIIYQCEEDDHTKVGKSKMREKRFVCVLLAKSCL